MLQLISIEQQIIQNFFFATDIIQFFMRSKSGNERGKCMRL